MSFSIQTGNFLYKHLFFLYKPLYTLFKLKQDSFELGLLKKYVTPGAVVLDIGANIGFYAGILSKLVGPDGEVHCFEPDEKNFNYLRASTKSLKNVSVNHKAVGPRTEKIKIYTSKDLNVDHRTYQPEEFDEEIEIEAVSIDDYFEAGSRVDLIKMDIQGFEMQAIKGMKRTITENPGIRIISEFWPYGLNKAGSSLTEYYNFLIAEHFHIYLLHKDSLQLLDPAKVKSLEMLGKEHYFNIFATRKSV
ncbi:MAG: FkbM family methyltransferase [Flavitalea sp.]